MRQLSLAVCVALCPALLYAQESATPHLMLEQEALAARGIAAQGVSAAKTESPASPTLLALTRPGNIPGPCRTIFGYLPYWERSAALPNIRWNLLTHIACFSIGVNSSGTVTTFNGWPSSWTTVVNTAHTNGVKVILCVTLFDDAAIATLMGSTANKNAFFANMKAQILAGNADGLNVDFEGTGSWRSTFHTFLSELTTYLHAQIPGCEVTFAGPAIPSGLNVTSVAAACDGIFIMGYAFAGSWSSTSGANAPLSSITSVVDSSSRWGPVKNSTPQKLILGLPYYGAHWKTTTSAARAPVLRDANNNLIGYVGSTRFRDDATDAFLPGREWFWDTTTQTPWYRWNDGTNWHQVWDDDAQSLGLKFSLAHTRNLQGVGMWALNYDGDRPELWEELNRQFGKPCLGPILPDFNGDGDVDQGDFSSFQLCLGNPDTPAKLPDCWKGLLDTDTDVDADDLAMFVKCMSGAGIAGNVSCLSP